MNEWQLFGIGLTKFSLVLLFAVLYSIAGRDNTPKWLRRFLAPILLISGSVWLSFTYTLSIFILSSISLIILIVGLCLGYGSDDILTKIRKRFICSLVICSAGIPIILSTGRYSLLILQYIIGISASIILGCKNEVDAPNEEFLIGLLTTLLIPFMY